MLNSLETRVPILDHIFCELSFRIPSGFKLKNGNSKYILKKALEKYLPQPVLAHRKQGFAVPLEFWFRKDLREYVYSSLNYSSSSDLYDFIDKKYVKKLLDYQFTGLRDFSGKMYSLIFFAEWLKQNRER
jgi:asparagine synthase (glutamine-hydrolysing)